MARNRPVPYIQNFLKMTKNLSKLYHFYKNIQNDCFFIKMNFFNPTFRHNFFSGFSSRVSFMENPDIFLAETPVPLCVPL